MVPLVPMVMTVLPPPLATTATGIWATPIPESQAEVKKVRKALGGRLGYKASKARLDHKAQRVTPVTQAPQDQKEILAIQAHKALKETKETLALKEKPARKAPKGRREKPAREACRVCRVKRAKKEIRATRSLTLISPLSSLPRLKAEKAIPERRGLKVIQVHGGHRANKARRESEAPQVLTAQQAYKAPLAQKETLVIPALPGRAPTPPLKLAVTRAHRSIFTLTLPQCRGLRRRLRRFKEVES